MNTAELLDGVKRIAGLLELEPAELAATIGEGLELVTDAIRLAEKDPTVANPAAILQLLRTKMRDGVSSSWQQAIDDAGAFQAIYDLASARLRTGPLDPSVDADLREIARCAAVALGLGVGGQVLP